MPRAAALQRLEKAGLTALERTERVNIGRIEKLVGHAGEGTDMAAMMKAIDDFCASQGKGGFWEIGTMCRDRVMEGLENGNCAMYVKNQTLGSYVVDCK